MKDEEALQAVFSRASGVLINLDESAPPATYALPEPSSSTVVAERPMFAENRSADPSGLNRATRPAPPDVAAGTVTGKPVAVPTTHALPVPSTASPYPKESWPFRSVE